MMWVKTRLTRNEIATIRILASLRVIANDAAGITDNAVLNDEERRLIGVIAEYAFCKKFNVFMDLSSVPRSGSFDCLYKGYRVDIKTTIIENGNLIAYAGKKNPDVDIFILAVYKEVERSVEFIGWCYSHELYNENNLKDIGYGPTYVIERSKLKPLRNVEATVR